jgi:AcrR family transcriptional regulator
VGRRRQAVGIGSTALYHYFESKLHCLYEIMAEALEAELEKFERITGEHEDFATRSWLRRAVRPLEHESAQPPARLRAGARRRAPDVRARGGGAPARAQRTRDLEFKWARS